MKILAVTTVKNEGAFILEWLAHHRAVGFTDFLVFSNDCSDGTDLILDKLDEAGLITHERNPGPHEGGVQWQAMKIASKHDQVRNADWILALDIDEFVNIHAGEHRVADLLAALPEADAITLTWRLFGNDGIRDFVDVPVTEQFTKAAPAVMYWPWRASMFKTLYRNDGTYGKLGVHRPRQPDRTRLPDCRWYDCSGRKLPVRFLTKQLFSPFGRNNYLFAQLNHYPLQSMQSYLVKRDRGRAVHGEDLLGMSYWCDRNWNTDHDDSVNAISPQRARENERLLKIEGLPDLHAKAVAWRHEKIDSLLLQEPYRALLGRLIATPALQPLTAESASYLYRFAQLDNGQGD